MFDLTPCNRFNGKPDDCRKLYIFGAGAFAPIIAWTVAQSWGSDVQLRYVVDEERFLTGPLDDVPVILLREITPDSSSRFIVSLGDPAHRAITSKKCSDAGLVAATIVHPRAEIAGSAVLEDGVVICAGSIVGTNNHIGRHVLLNFGAIVGHDVHIGDYSVISPRACIAGHVEIGEGAFLGMGANVINGKANAPLVIGAGAFVAAGACVTRSVEPGAMVAGVPATRRR